MNDQQRVVSAVRAAQLILAQFRDSDQPNAEKVIGQLLAVLDRSDVVEAADRLKL
jgi:hypothetical protein